MTPDGWRREPIGSLGHVHAGRQRSPHFTDGSKRPYLRVANVFHGSIDTSDVFEMLFTDAEFERYRLTIGDILLNEGQSLDLVGRAAIYHGSPPECAFQNTLVRFRAAPDVEATFALHLFRHLHQSKVFASIATQTTSIAHLGVSRFAALEVGVPPLGEQRKIAAILSSVDDAIDATQVVIDQLQVVKKAMMGELLTRGLPGRHTRFKQTAIGDAPVSWDVLPLSEVAAVQTGIAKGKLVERGVALPYLRVANVQDGRVELAEMKTILVEEAQIERYRLRAGDVLFTEGGDADKLGRGCVWQGQVDPCLHQNHVFAVRSDRKRLLPEFLAYWAAGPKGKAYFLDCAKQTTNLASINSTQLKAFPVPVIPMEEQVNLVDVLRSVDGRIEVERIYAVGLQACKAALMFVLLTGELRVKPDEEAA